MSDGRGSSLSASSPPPPPMTPAAAAAAAATAIPPSTLSGLNHAEAPALSAASSGYVAVAKPRAPPPPRPENLPPKPPLRPKPRASSSDSHSPHGVALVGTGPVGSGYELGSPPQPPPPPPPRHSPTPPSDLASKEFQKGFESPRPGDKLVTASSMSAAAAAAAASASLYASGGFRHETNGGTGGSDSPAGARFGGLCANTLSKLDGPVGFSTLPEQVYNKTVKRGFEFTLMVCGESGLGKSTLVNSLFCADIYSADYPGPSQRTVQKTIQVETTKVVLQEGQVTLTLTIVDTPGFGGNLDNSNCWAPLIDFIEDKYAEYLQEETKIQRSAHIVDNRVHCCLYFIAPSGHGLKPLDVEVMKKLHDKVNIVPVIAKADTFTPEECQLFKRRIQNELTQHGIKVYDFPSLHDIGTENGSVDGVAGVGGVNAVVGGGDATGPAEARATALALVSSSKSARDRLPFAVVGSNALVDVGGRKLRARKYPWGIVEVDSVEHCDFIPLRNMLIRSHMQDLKEVTHNCHYEHFRVRKLTGGACAPEGSLSSNKNPLAQMEEEKKEHDAKIEKMRQEMETVFAMKVKEKLQKLEDNEAERTRRHEQQMKSLEQQRAELEERERNFERERAAFEATHKEYEDMFRKMTLDSREGAPKSNRLKRWKSVELLRLGKSFYMHPSTASSQTTANPSLVTTPTTTSTTATLILASADVQPVAKSCADSQQNQYSINTTKCLQQ